MWPPFTSFGVLHGVQFTFSYGGLNRRPIGVHQSACVRGCGFRGLRQHAARHLAGPFGPLGVVRPAD
eukprot:3765691-Lingulodinium_polyedra.AAC.1